MKSLYVFSFLVALFAATNAATYDDFCNDKNDGYFPDPKNCIKYYHCFKHAVEDHLICPNEGGVQQLYDPDHVWCDYPNKVDCGDRPICDENDENCDEAPTTVTDPTAPTKAPFECPEPSGYFADPNNCMKYYHCYEGAVEEHLNCPLDTLGKQELYDPDHMWCDHPERVDCGSRPICDKNDENCVYPTTTKPKTTTPIDFDCPQPNGYFPDPKNCIKYYHCYEGVVEERITCPKVNGKQECFDPVNTWCDWPERVDCGNRPICDENDENCNTPPTAGTTTPRPTGPTTTPRPDRCAQYGSCTMDQDGLGPYKAEGPCEQCFCQCVAAGFYSEVCCEPGLVFNEITEQCDFPFNMPDCE